MRYCPECKRKVGVKLTIGQILLMYFLFLFIVPGIIWCIKHKRKCPICAAPTEELFDDPTHEEPKEEYIIITDEKDILSEINKSNPTESKILLNKLIKTVNKKRIKKQNKQNKKTK